MRRLALRQTGPHPDEIGKGQNKVRREKAEPSLAERQQSQDQTEQTPQQQDHVENDWVIQPKFDMVEDFTDSGQ